jgi:hypothetical protein
MLKPKALSEVLAQVTNGGIQSTVYVRFSVHLSNITTYFFLLLLKIIDT